VAEVKVWRRQERARLIAARLAMSPAMRRDCCVRITAELETFLSERPGALGVFWPFQAEFDPRPLIETLTAAGRVVALPAVIDRHGPLEYRAWRPGENLVSGVWDIPISEKRKTIMPAMVLAPLVELRWRLLSTRLWRGLFRPDACGIDATPVCHPRRV